MAESTPQYKWQSVRKHLQALGYPGDGNGWDMWFQESWSYITSAGMADFNVPSELVEAKVRIMALCWIAQDFCAVTEFNQYYTDIYLSEWMEELSLDALTLGMTLQCDEEMADIRESPFFCEKLGMKMEDGSWYVADEVNDDFVGRIRFAAVQRQRAKVIDALLTGFGGCHWLFASLYAAKMNSLEEKWHRKEELWSQIDELQEELDSTEDAASKHRLQKQIEAANCELTDEKIDSFVTERLRTSSLDESVGMGDDATSERMAGYLWCSDCCPTYILVDFSA